MEAFLYESLEGGAVRCNLCAHRCKIQPEKRGICGVRENVDGALHTRVYGRLIARGIDPVEKKPLHHLLPGTLSYSVATVGCNFQCRFCQNADIAQMPADRKGHIMGAPISPADVVAQAGRGRCASIAYTYTEPTVFFEFAHDTAKLARENGLRNVWVSNGYLTPEALEMIGPFLDGANIDLKSFSDEFYKTICGARLEPVLNTLRGMVARNILVEVTTLIVPDLNDDPEELRRLAGFIAEELSPDTPWHISRFHPTYKLTDRPPTPVETLQKAYDIGKAAGLRYVYMGNVTGRGGEDTDCPDCGETVIRRRGFAVTENRLAGGKCPDCGAAVHGVWE